MQLTFLNSSNISPRLVKFRFNPIIETMSPEAFDLALKQFLVDYPGSTVKRENGGVWITTPESNLLPPT